MFNLINININLNLGDLLRDLFKRRVTKIVKTIKSDKNKSDYGRRRRSLYCITDKILEENLKMFYPNCKDIHIQVRY